MWLIDISDQARKDIKKHQKAGDKKLLEKIKELTGILAKNPHAKIAHRESLKHQFAGYESCRINDKHRMVFYLDETTKTVFIDSLYGHY